MKVLWLCSWYPHSKDLFDGDFIERQAKALAMYEKVDVIHVVQNFQFLKDEKYRVEEQQSGALSAKIYFIPLPRISNNFLKKIIFNQRYNHVIQQAVNNYIAVNGKPDLIHLHVPVKAGSAALHFKRKLLIPFVVTEHSSAYFEHIPENYFNRNRYFRLVSKQSFEQAAIVSSVSNWLLTRLEQLFHIKQSRLIRNAVDTTIFFSPISNHQKKVFIHVSMMHPLKNVNGILAALAALNKVNTNWQMNFIGPASTHNMKLAFELGLDKQVAWKGTFTYDEVAKEMQQATALVHFSKYENLPCVVNEALCCGLPVISSNVGGIEELINEDNGILVESENIEQLANAMASFLEKPERFNQQQISAEAAAQFNYEIIGKEIVDMYQQVLLQY